MEERAVGYHNPARGDYRLALLSSLVGSVLEGRERTLLTRSHPRA